MAGSYDEQQEAYAQGMTTRTGSHGEEEYDVPDVAGQVMCRVLPFFILGMGDLFYVLFRLGK